ncbi:AmmeMemoRadiSam system protein A [Spirochaetia bacterium]|nr:AmmeMemoRadiSam system protein A [Spirochaetia bacterium]
MDHSIGDFSIDTDLRRFLLASARESITAELEGRPPVRPPLPSGQPHGQPQSRAVLEKECGAFVSLHINGGLRGCIGRMSAGDPLEKTVRIMALEAAFHDPRFPPLDKAELGRCLIEISVLSPPEPMTDPRSAKIGVHGLWLMHRGRSGVFLPQVPVEQGWDLPQYLEQLCYKAGLSPGAYDEKDARLYSFTAVVFSEE